jgi:peptidyl-prolyl cis-trans isomerase SurA
VDRVVAEVNGEVITMSELQEAVLVYLRDTRERPPESAEETLEVQRRVLRRLVDVRLQVQEARREKIQVTDEEIHAILEDLARRSEEDRAELERRKADSRAWERTRRELRDQLLAQRIRGRRLSRRASVTEAEVDAYVAANRAKLEADLKYHPRHIAVLAQPADQPAAWTEARAKIDRLRAEIVAGADFAEVARQHSQDASARVGGDLDWLARGELQPLFEEAILRLEKGGVTEPIRSASGFHLFLLQDREEVSPEGLAQFRQQARDLLLQKKVQERQDEWLDDLRRRALIAVRL